MLTEAHHVNAPVDLSGKWVSRVSGTQTDWQANFGSG